jgi:hypothetical protein
MKPPGIVLCRLFRTVAPGPFTAGFELRQFALVNNFQARRPLSGDARPSLTKSDGMGQHSPWLTTLLSRAEPRNHREEQMSKMLEALELLRVSNNLLTCAHWHTAGRMAPDLAGLLRGPEHCLVSDAGRRSHRSPNPAAPRAIAGLCW